MSRLVVLLSILLVPYSSFSKIHCEKLFLTSGILQRITNKAKDRLEHIARDNFMISMQRRTIRKRLFDSFGELKPHYKGIVGQFRYSAKYHQRYTGPMSGNVDAAYKSVERYLTAEEMKQLGWGPPRIANGT